MSELIDNRAHRIRTLKHIIRHLHRGDAPEQVKGQLAQLVGETDASEIAAMEQELIAEGMPVQEVKSMCDLHARVLQDITVERIERPIPRGHPIDTFKQENQALATAVEPVRQVLSEVASLAVDAAPGDLPERLRAAVNPLHDVTKHYARKENLLFSCLERHGITGPSKVMWAKDDEVREQLAALAEALRAGASLSSVDLQVVCLGVAEPMLQSLTEMIYKEDKILLPMASSALTEDEWGEIFVQSPSYGWCLVEPRHGWTPPQPAGPPKTAVFASDEAIPFGTGALSLDQLRGILGVLPVDITFVDADDRVRFFSEGDRIFQRSKAILGRQVQQCHPPKSVDTVEKILADFRSGSRNVAEFWIQMHGKFVHIRYFAVRDQQGVYLGTLEVTQDLTALRALTGERRLLEYQSQEDAS